MYKKTSHKRTQYSPEFFVNSLGQTINPGDEIVMIVSGYNHLVKIRKGIYLGLRKGDNGKVKSVTVSYDEMFLAPNSESFFSGKSIKKQLIKKQLIKISTLPNKMIFPLF